MKTCPNCGEMNGDTNVVRICQKDIVHIVIRFTRPKRILAQLVEVQRLFMTLLQ